MSPHEHQLSQAVLEFLIAHQDWFMFDIPPPPSSRNVPSAVAAAPTAATVTSHHTGLIAPNRSGFLDEDINVVPSSEDEQSHVGGGWKLVDKRKQSGQEGSAAGPQKRVTRRHTVIDRKRKSCFSVRSSACPALFLITFFQHFFLLHSCSSFILVICLPFVAILNLLTF
jgi:hypothetical protein